MKVSEQVLFPCSYIPPKKKHSLNFVPSKLVKIGQSDFSKPLCRSSGWQSCRKIGAWERPLPPQKSQICKAFKKKLQQSARMYQLMLDKHASKF